jgi:hypothetical protein
LIALMENAVEDGSIIFPILEMNTRGRSTPAELATFITVTSDFYADLGLPPADRRLAERERRNPMGAKPR